MKRFTVHGTPYKLEIDPIFEAADPTISITLTADSDAEAQRIAYVLCSMDVQEIECAECLSVPEECFCYEQGEAV